MNDGPTRSPNRLHADLTSLDALAERLTSTGDARTVRARAAASPPPRALLLTKNGEPRRRIGSDFTPALFVSLEARRRHEQAMQALAPGILEEFERLDAHIRLLARGLLRLLAIAAEMCERLLEEHALLDFAGMLARSGDAARAAGRIRAQPACCRARYHHVGGRVPGYEPASSGGWSSC